MAMLETLEKFYEKKYKYLFFIPLIILILSLVYLSLFASEHGEIVKTDVSLRGGLSATVYVDSPVDINSLDYFLKENLGDDVLVRSLVALEGSRNGIIIETSAADAKTLEPLLEEHFGFDLNEENFFTQETGSRLGQNFYGQMIRALLIAFLLMSIVVFFTFRSFVPSLAVVFSAFFDLTVTLTVINLLGMRISAAGISALILLVSYSVDTDVLLTTRMLKRRGEGKLFERVLGAFKTGMTMTLTAFGAVLIGYFLSTSAVLKEIFLIIAIGLVIDIVATYAMNAGILWIYMKRKYNE